MRSIATFARLPLMAACLIVALLSVTPSAVVAGAPPITVPFDHFSTGFELDGVHRELPCESCHLNAVFKGTPRNCGVCHITGSTFNATPKTTTHIQSTNDCGACHNTISFRPDVHFDHHEVMGNCIVCHNGTIAQGEGPAHPKSSTACEACHTTISWNPPKAVDHTQFPLAVQGFCIICHNGVQASGKTSNHIPTKLECGDCHLTTTWLGANFDHTGILSNCVSCHNGTRAVGKHGNHMPTSNSCEACHTTGLGTKTPSWAPSAFEHTQMAVTTCQTCHSGSFKITTGFVSGQPVNHVPPIPSSIDCGVCHGNNPTAETWAVLAASIPTLHTGLNTGNCLLCHAGQTFAGVPAPYIPMSISGVSPTKKTPLAPAHIAVLVGSDCSACHGAAYAVGGFGPATAMSAAKHAFVATTCNNCHETGKSVYVGSGTPLQLRPADHLSTPSNDSRKATGDCSLCHSTTDWNSTALPIGHMPNPGNQACAVCHIAGPTNYKVFAANSVLHTGINGGCAQCHGAAAPLPFYNNDMVIKSGLLTPMHIPYLTGSDCSACHSSTTYAVGGFGPNTMSAAKHAFVPSTCSTCHGVASAATFYPGAALNLQIRPTDTTHSSGQAHTGDCSGCHNTTSWITTVLPLNHMPNPGSQACTVCHTAAPANYTALASIAVLHTGISTGCAQCHGSTQRTFYNNFSPKSAVLSPPPHIPALTGTDCSFCHTTTYVAGGFGPMNMTAAKHAFVPTACITCHEAGRSFYMGAAVPGLEGRPANHVSSGTAQATGDCSQCHNTANWNSSTIPAGHMPNPGNQACSVCHTGAPSNYKTLAPNPVLHTGIGSGCNTCHGAPNAAPWVFYLNFSPKAASGLAPPHIPSGATPCEDCHSASTFTSFGGTNMSASKHALMFGFIGGTCDACHEIGKTFYGVNNLTVRPDPNHGGGQDCNQCHSPNGWGGGKASKKTAVPQTATRSTVGLVVNSGMAPRQSKFGSAVAALIPMSHAGVVSNCFSCHNGVLATGKGVAHIASNNACENCHTTPAWLPARFDHRGVTAACASCHNGVHASGKPTHHVLTTQDCSTCHGTFSWAAASFNHVGVHAACQSCHNSVTATGKQFRHLATAQDCGSCHNTLNWTVTTPAAPLKPLIQRPKPHPAPHGAASQ